MGVLDRENQVVYFALVGVVLYYGFVVTQRYLDVFNASRRLQCILHCFGAGISSHAIDDQRDCGLFRRRGGACDRRSEK